MPRDSDVMVQKGYGWMLKEASNNYPNEVFDYVMKRKKEMPRIALRYAIDDFLRNEEADNEEKPVWRRNVCLPQRRL